MPKLLSHNGVVDDPYQVLGKDFAGDLPTGPILVSLPYWLGHREALRQRPRTGVWLDSDDEPEAVAADVDVLTCIGVNFPTFMDGRGFSIGRLLRERHGFQGELRAIGHIIADQLFFLKRCGFDSFLMPDDFDPAQSQNFLNAFTVTYQAGVDNPLPWFRRPPG